MKATNVENCQISKLIENQLNIVFNNKEFLLGKWGHVDNYCELKTKNFILLECEKGQDHPNTNVLKLYPFLEENSNLKIVLLHYFFPENEAPKNRLNLCDFIGRKMEVEFNGRFQYLKLPQDIKMVDQFFKQEKKGLLQQLLRGKIRVKV